ncbi:MAG: transcription elongation factor GreA [Treponema sp.]|nr:transcription elongation factor GreA [Treponema sp.]
MKEALIQSVQEMLKEETWTRATISNYTQNNLEKLADIVDQTKAADCENEILTLCKDHLAHTKDSIIALYLTGVLSLLKGSLDNSNFETLVDIFQKNHKESIVTYLCEDILEKEPSNKFALRTLASIYLAENNDKVWDLYTTIVKVDYEEAELAKTLAEHYESLGNEALAIEYYKKAILRFINNGNDTNCSTIWAKLIKKIPLEIDFFNLLRGKISKTFGDYKASNLMFDLYEEYKDRATQKEEQKETANQKDNKQEDDNKLWDIAIAILKQILEVDPSDKIARNELTNCYRAKYAKHSRLENYLSSTLNAGYRNVFEAINDFEKHIAFDKGGFVYHKDFGVGVIVSLKEDVLKICFNPKQPLREMSLKMAVTALKPLSQDHIWVIKAKTKDKAKLAAKIKEEKVWALKTIIKSFDNNCDFKTIKAELVPSLLSNSEWTSWNAAAKKILETDSSFGINPNDINMYTVRTQEITTEEKLSNEFKAQKQFFARADILMSFFKNEKTDNSNELFTEMYSYFAGFLKNISKVNEYVIASYLLVRSIRECDKSFALPSEVTFAELYRKLENPRETYVLLKDSKNTTLKKDFLTCIKMIPNWNEEYIKLFPTVLDMALIDDLIDNGFTEDVQKLVRISFENFKDYREATMFFFKECQDKEWFKSAGVSDEKQIIALINIIELTFREINNHVNSTENKKINKNATQLLFVNDALYNLMFGKDEANVKKIYTLIDDISDFDATIKAAIRNKILENYPDFKFRVSEEKTSQPKGMLVTLQKLEEKKTERDRIQTEDMPKNAQEIATAKEKGDLKENQEYKSAKETQHFLSLRLAKLQEELNRAVVFDPTTTTTSVVSFGTVVTITNDETNENQTVTILGPWESDPKNNIISYMSPFGNALMDKKIGEKAVYSIEGKKHAYTIKDIKKAKI